MNKYKNSLPTAHAYQKQKTPPLLKWTFWMACLLPGIACASWYDQKLEGWYYFEDPSASPTKEKLTPQQADTLLAIESKQLKQLLSLALISPTTENVEQYVRAQKKLMQQSSNFAQSWGKILLEHPELGEFLTTPTSTYGILAKRSEDLRQRKELLKTLSQSHFLIFFYKGKDPLAAKAADVAQLFASTNGWKYKAVSLDGVGLSQFQEFEIDKGISKILGVEASPSFYIINPVDNQAFPVGAGMISVSELQANIVTQMEDSQ